VTYALRKNPQGLTRLPGQVDLFEEIRREHRRLVTRAYAKTGTVTGVALALGVSVSDASRWVNNRKLILPSKYRQFPKLRERARKLIRDAFVRANGSPMRAARLLTTDCSVAGALGREFSPEDVRSNRRPDLTTDGIASLVSKGWSHARIAAHVGVGESTINRRARRGGIESLLRTRPELPDSAFAALRASGLKYREIAERLKVSVPTVCVRLRRAKGLAKCAAPVAEAAG
jgi:transposase